MTADSEYILTPLKQSELINLTLKTIPRRGILKQTHGGYVYLKVDDRYILDIFPLMDIIGKKLPPYFSAPNDIGAHISVIYRDEPKEPLNISEVNCDVEFHILKLCQADILGKIFYVLTVQSDALTAIRKKYGFSEKPCYHSIPVDFHITIGRG